jgi:two-component system KDP operon response regulator KdpE
MTVAGGHFTVLIVDDEPANRRSLRTLLEGAGYRVLEVAAGPEGLAEAGEARPDLVVLELRLAGLPGTDLISRLRLASAAPLMVLSAFIQEATKIEALDAGADDYLSEPFGSGELFARLRVLLRRAQVTDPAARPIAFGSVEVDLGRRLVTKRGVAVRLTAKEYAFLQLLVTHRDQSLTHRQILSEIWGPKAEMHTHYLRIFMLRLRRKLEDRPEAPRHFLTESGIGYRLVTAPRS